MKTILVTGAAGFIGSHLCERFLNEGYNVLGIDDLSTGSQSNVDLLIKMGTDKFQFQRADVSKEWLWIQKTHAHWWDSLEFVFHFASPASPKYFRSLSLETIWANTVGLERCMQEANRRGARVIFASTSEIYGNPEVHPQPETYTGNVNSFGPRASYNEAKRLGETLIYCYNERHGIRHGIVRIFNTYGPRMSMEDGRVVINFLREALSNRSIPIYGSGQQSRSFCYIDDLVEGIVRYARSPLYEPVNLGSETEIQINELASEIKFALKDQGLVMRTCVLPAEDPVRRRPDVSKARKMLNGWEARVNLRAGLKKTADWVKNLQDL